MGRDVVGGARNYSSPSAGSPVQAKERLNTLSAKSKKKTGPRPLPKKLLKQKVKYGG